MPALGSRAPPRSESLARDEVGPSSLLVGNSGCRAEVTRCKGASAQWDLQRGLDPSDHKAQELCPELYQRVPFLPSLLTWSQVCLGLAGKVDNFSSMLHFQGEAKPGPTGCLGVSHGKVDTPHQGRRPGDGDVSLQ